MIQKLPDRDQITYIEKTVRLENEFQLAKSDTIKLLFQYKSQNRNLCFKKALQQLCSLGYPLEDSQIFFWDNARKIYVFIGCFPTDA